MIPSPVDVPVVGLTFFPHYPDIAWRLQPRVPIKAWLRRNPDNPHDPNAIEVWVRNYQLGHISRSMARKLAPQMDKGVRWRAQVVRVEVHPDHPDRPGIWLTLIRGRD